MPPSTDPRLAIPLSQIAGVGPERSAQLARLGLRTTQDLLLHRPRRYEDRRHFLPIRNLRMGEAATTRGRIVAQGIKTYRRGSRSTFEFVIEDGSARLHCRWWNLPYMERYFRVGDDVMVFGKPSQMAPRTLDHPETEVVVPGEEISIHMDRVVPVYPLTEGLPQRWLRSLVWRILTAQEHYIEESYPRLAAWIASGTVGVGGQLGAGNGQEASEAQYAPLPSRREAIRRLHFPEELAEAEGARERLALDEFIRLQIRIQTRRKKLNEGARRLPCAGDNSLIKPFLAKLGFNLTKAQTWVLREIRADMGGPHPMRRLLQGDVGSGKTVVAACTALMTLESGYNVVMMAPTEILAEQHHKNFTRWFRPLGLEVRLRTANWKTEEGALAEEKTRQVGLEPAASPEKPSLTIGTHALIEPAFSIEKLGLVIIDEQHKFGVAQRETLLRKGVYPHLLIMTATPIPRTLGLTLYGDLDSSIIGEMPPGRGRVRTFVRSPAQLPKVYEFIRSQITLGRQAYIVYPRVEETDMKRGAKAVKQEYDRLAKELGPHQVGLLYGGQRPEEKAAVMDAFRANRIQALLSTSVIEVGVDVPNATVLLVENAEQFGLAQLHQLRGRIGRGGHESYCVLVAKQDTAEARQRLRVLEETSDGFEVAEADMRFRGPGELLGQQQSGLPAFKFGDLAKDRRLIEWARVLATQWLAGEV